MTEEELDELTRAALAPARWYRYFTQGEQWWPNGKPPVRIADMDQTWRYNAAGWLVRQSPRLARLFREGCWAEEYWVDLYVTAEMANESLHGDLREQAAAAGADPAAWVVTTPLYRALAADLPEKGAKRRKLAARAHHWSGCPGRLDHKTRECICSVLRSRHEREQELTNDRPKG